jgi:hypothetical protein
MAGQVEDERERRQDGGAERTPGADPVPLPRPPPVESTPTAACREHPDRREVDYRYAGIPVIASPSTSVWMLCVPS